MADDSRAPVAPACSENELSTDADHRAILARRDLLIAVAMTGVLASCGSNSSSGSHSGDAAPPPEDHSIPLLCVSVSADAETTESGGAGVDGADDGGASLDAGGTEPNSNCFCVY